MIETKNRRIYDLALSIERFGFRIGSMARRNYRWSSIAMALMCLQDYLKRVYFKW